MSSQGSLRFRAARERRVYSFQAALEISSQRRRLDDCVILKTGAESQRRRAIADSTRGSNTDKALYRAGIMVREPAKRAAIANGSPIRLVHSREPRVGTATS